MFISRNFQLPPLIENSDGKIRKVGFEIEFTGIELTTAAQAVAEIFGGKVIAESRFLYRVVETAYG